jgi:hypothetical protein
MQRVNSPFQAMKDIFVKPNQVFATIKETHNWSWIPFICISMVGVIPVYMYFNFVDFDWYNEFIVQSMAANLSPAEQNMLRSSMTDQTQSLWAGVFSSVIVVILSNAVLALYLNIVTKADAECVQGYTDWYGFSWWVSIPFIISNLIAALVVLLALDNQLLPISLSPTSIAFIFNLSTDSDWFSFAQSIRLESFWIMYLMAVGLSQWTQLPPKKTYVIAIAPYALIWSGWALVVLF